MKTKRRFTARLFGNWLLAFLSPLMGAGGTVLVVPEEWDPNIKILITALISASIVTGFVIVRELDKYGKTSK